MSNVLILTSDVIRERMAGPAIRAWHIASELSKAHSVRLVSTSPTQSDKASDGFAVLSARLDGDLRVHTKWADVLIIQGQILTEYPWM
ncbi:MAG: glycosyltransferase family 1 protein, partial [Agromyces sp.]